MVSVNLDWTDFKTFLSDRSVGLHYVETSNYYLIYAFDGPLSAELKLNKNGSSDLTDFETNYKSGGNLTFTDSVGHTIQTNSPFADSGGFRARFKGISGTATKDTTTNIDYKLTEDRFINGVRLMLADHVDGDYVDFQIVDVDNILGYGAGVVLDEFGTSWYMDSSICTQPDVLVPYPAKIFKDLYIRIKYTSVGTVDDVSVRANLYLHKKS